MNLKYYLRGLGIGIIVTALILGFSVGGKEKTLSNEEIKERAKALGMTEESVVLADLVSDGSEGEEKPEGNPDIASSPSGSVIPVASPENTAGPEAENVSPTPDQTEKPEETVVPEKTPEATPGAAATVTPAASPRVEAEPTATPKQTPSATPEAESAAGSKDTITIQIVSGDTSYSISGKLEEAGLVTSAYEYDLYLCEKGYDKRLNVGTFEVPVGANPEEIARILARME